jgi:hypothetical protein
MTPEEYRTLREEIKGALKNCPPLASGDHRERWEGHYRAGLSDAPERLMWRAWEREAV